MKNITLSADEELIERARATARSQHTTLNAAFREWLRQYSGRVEAAARYDALMKSFSHINSGRKFTREEMNER